MVSCVGGYQILKLRQHMANADKRHHPPRGTEVSRAWAPRHCDSSSHQKWSRRVEEVTCMSCGRDVHTRGVFSVCSPAALSPDTKVKCLVQTDFLQREQRYQHSRNTAESHKVPLIFFHFSDWISNFIPTFSAGSLMHPSSKVIFSLSGVLWLGKANSL